MKWMKGRLRFLLPLLLLAILAGCQGDSSQKNEADATAVAQKWLAMLDEGKYGDAWQASADAIRNQGTQQQFEDVMKQQRAPMGKVISRTVETAQYGKNPQNFPPGEYVEVKFKTSFQNAQSVEEVVQLIKTADGSWKVGAYLPNQNQ
jgi:outer membrane biogenesis lipoprotein LolB